MPTLRAPSVNAAATTMAGSGAVDAAPQFRLDMLALYNSGGGVRSLIYQALKRPDDGGYAYAMMMLAQCELPHEKLAPQLSPASAQALAQLRARCDMTVPEKRQFETLFTDRRGHWKRDPLLNAIMSYGDAGTPGDQRDIEQQLLTMQDPIALDFLLSPLPGESNGQPALSTYFLGKQYDINGPPMMSHAILLAYCKLGLQCGSDSLLALRLCMERGLCGGSVEEALRTGSGSGKDFPAIETLANRIVHEFRRRNLAAFHPGA